MHMAKMYLRSAFVSEIILPGGDCAVFAASAFLALWLVFEQLLDAFALLLEPFD